jgi:hypothetical protein
MHLERGVWPPYICFHKAAMNEMQQEQLLKAITFINALKPLLVITYRFTFENDSYYRCAMTHVLFWISGTSPNLVMDYSKVLVSSGKRFNTVRAVAKPVGETILFTWEKDLLPKEYATDKVRQCPVFVIVIYLINTNMLDLE